MGIWGYHANYNGECKEFVENDSYLIISKDTHYLGTGMYFWDNLDRAEWWLITKKTKGEACIVKAFIDTTSLLDIRHAYALDKIQEMYEIMLKCVKKREPNIKELKLGEILDIIFEFFEDDLKSYTGIYGTVKNLRRPEHKFLKGTPMTIKPEDMILVKKSIILSDRNYEDKING